jgi:hypothetical protein
LWAVHDCVLDLKLAFFSDEAWIHLSGYTNAEINRYWRSKEKTDSSPRAGSGNPTSRSANQEMWAKEIMDFIYEIALLYS